MDKSTFFYHQTINVFTDASCIELEPIKYNKLKATSPGFIATYGGRVLSTGMEVYINEHSVYGEAKAIELAITWCIYAASKGLYVPEGYSIFSDNLVVVNQICHKLMEWFNMLNSNQRSDIISKGKVNAITWEDIVFNSAFSIFTSGLPIRIFFVSSHVNLRPFSHLKAQDKFIKLNEPNHGDLSNEITAQILHEQSTFNNMVDMMTRNFLIVHKQDIENDINMIEDDNIDLANNKIEPLRWPFVFNGLTYNRNPQLLIGQY